MNAANRWAIYIDVEGTSKLYTKDADQFHAGFGKLLGAVYAIGDQVYPEPPARLFAHQVGGDGIVIVSDFEEDSPERFVSIAVILLEVLLVNGLVGKAGISTGTFYDIQGCVPSLREVPNANDAAYSMGAGLLTTLKVMGTALVNSHHFAEVPPRGSRLAVEPALLMKIAPGAVISDFGGPVVVDRIHTKTATIEHIIKTAGLDLPTSSELKKKLIAYVSSTGPLADTEWGRNTLSLNGCSPDGATAS
ncbi:MAG: hypothetical protein HY736_09685 [Verrucomicrobia bacterium]|nr:hypothetical protein [Verrucomicrobiota bacterium]